MSQFLSLNRSLLKIERRSFFVSDSPYLGNGYDSGNEKAFVNIDATAYWIKIFHGNCSPCKFF